MKFFLIGLLAGIITVVGCSYFFIHFGTINNNYLFKFVVAIVYGIIFFILGILFKLK